jgi:hypothetical protein
MARLEIPDGITFAASTVDCSAAPTIRLHSGVQFTPRASLIGASATALNAAHP